MPTRLCISLQTQAEAPTAFAKRQSEAVEAIGDFESTGIWLVYHGKLDPGVSIQARCQKAQTYRQDWLALVWLLVWHSLFFADAVHAQPSLSIRLFHFDSSCFTFQRVFSQLDNDEPGGYDLHHRLASH
jgi:hypothetical protein